MKSKTLATWLAFLGGLLGTHWFYLGKKRAWAYLVFAPTGLSFFAGCIDALRIGLTPDEVFNRAYNPHLPPETPNSSALTVVGVGLTLAVGATALMSCLAILFQWYFTGSAG